MRSKRSLTLFTLYMGLLSFLIVSLFLLKQYMMIVARNTPVNLPFVKTVILGDSHARHGLNPDKIDSSINISQDSQNIIFSYYVLKKLISSGNRYQNVVLAYSYHSIGKNYVVTDDNEMMRRYHLILDKEFYSAFKADQLITPGIISRYYYDFDMIPIGISNDIYDLRQMQVAGIYPYIGDFEQNPKPRIAGLADFDVINKFNKKNSNHGSLVLSNIRDYKQIKVLIQEMSNKKYLQQTLDRHYFKGKIGISLITENYLELISKLCLQNGIQLYLVNIPVHSLYEREIPHNVIMSVDSLANMLESKYNAEYINLARYPLQDEYFFDYDHVTTPGANIISELINNAIIKKDEFETSSSR